MTINRPHAAAAIGLAAAGALLYVVDPATSGVYPSCPLRWLTGLLCPLCGGLRAAHELLHGRIAEALALNPFLLGAAIAGFAVPARWIAAVGLLFAVARNLT